MNFTPEQITRMAMDAEIGDSHGYIIRNELPHLKRFAELAAEAAIKAAPDYKMGYADGAAAEREACAKVQPIVTDANGVIRFRANGIVEHLLNTHPLCDMNKLAEMEFSDVDRQQFAQLIGYSISGYGDLSYVTDDAYEAAQQAAIRARGQS